MDRDAGGDGDNHVHRHSHLQEVGEPLVADGIDQSVGLVADRRGKPRTTREHGKRSGSLGSRARLEEHGDAGQLLFYEMPSLIFFAPAKSESSLEK